MAQLSHGRIDICTKTLCAVTRAGTIVKWSSRTFRQEGTSLLCFTVSGAKSCASRILRRISTSSRPLSSGTIVKSSLKIVTTGSVSVQHLSTSLTRLTPVVEAEEIGVIAPYIAQVRAIRELLRPVGLKGISVSSVEKFQGQVRDTAWFWGVGRCSFSVISTQERKVIIFATTRSNSEVDKRKAMGFLQNRQRMNGGHCCSSALIYRADAHPVSGHHTGTGSAYRDRRPGCTG